MKQLLEKASKFKFAKLMERGVLIFPFLLILGFVLNGFLASPVLATRAEEPEVLVVKHQPDDPSSQPLGFAILPPGIRMFQISPQPTPTNTPPPLPPTPTPTALPPTPTPTDTPTPLPPTPTPTLLPPTPTPTATPTLLPPTPTPTATPTLLPPTPTPTNTPIPNRPPEITKLTFPLSPVDIEQPIEVEAAFSDPDTGDTHTATWSWGDSNSSSCPPNNDDCSIDQINDVVNGSHSYDEPGVYQITLTVTDEAGLSDTEVSDFVIVYDPSGGFVTGGGWIYSEAGSCQDALVCETGAEGKVNFGFVSKYKRGANAPTGNAEFNFQAGELNFKSTTFAWLVINQGGSNAQFKGWGTINGENGPGNIPYQFMIWAKDDDPDTFRIKISYETPAGDVVVYDNGFNQPLGGGSIVVHKG